MRTGLVGLVGMVTYLYDTCNMYHESCLVAGWMILYPTWIHSHVVSIN